MIRFACPGCGATYTVEDAKGGKTGKCPKCQSQFVIPMPEEGAAPPPLPRSPAPPPPPSADPNAPVEIAPCPKCGARLSVAAADLGADVECPYCKTVYQAAREGAATAPPPTRSRVGDDRPSRRRDEDDDRPSRRRWDDDDRPSRRARDEDADDRLGRRDEEDDDYDRPRRRRRRQAEPTGAVTAVGIINYVLGALCLFCSCLMFAAGGFVKSALEQQQKKGGGPKGQAPIDPDTLTTLMYVMGGFYILYAVGLIVAGVGVTTRKTFGRITTFLTGGLAALLAVLSLFGALMNFVGGNAPGGCGAFIGALIWGAYAGFSLFTMARSGDEFS